MTYDVLEPEPDEDAITTMDHIRFYQYKKLVFKYTGRVKRGFHEFDESNNQCIRRNLAKAQFWPNVFFISDHGNAHLIRYWEDR